MIPTECNAFLPNQKLWISLPSLTGVELLQADGGGIVSQSWREEFGVDPEEPPTRIYF